MKYQLVRLEEHPRTGYTDYFETEGTVEDIVEWGLKKLKDQGRLRIETTGVARGHIKHGKHLNILVDKLRGGIDYGYCLILDPPKEDKKGVDPKYREINSDSRKYQIPHKFGDDNPYNEPEPKEVYCHECSKAGGAGMPIYHLPPACGFGSEAEP